MNQTQRYYPLLGQSQIRSRHGAGLPSAALSLHCLDRSMHRLRNRGNEQRLMLEINAAHSKHEAEAQIKASYQSLNQAKTFSVMAYDECSTAISWMCNAWLIRKNIQLDTGHGWASIRQQFMEKAPENLTQTMSHLNSQCGTLNFMLNGADEDPDNPIFNFTMEEYQQKVDKLVQDVEEWLCLVETASRGND